VNVAGARSTAKCERASSVSDGTRYYRSANATSVTVPAGSYVDVPVRAEGAGAAYNQPAVNVLVSPALPGVAVTSPNYGAGSSWRTADGRDEETDADLRARCVARWATLGRGATEAAYRYIATSCPAAPGVTRAAVVAGPGDGTLTLYLATSSGPASPTEVSLVAAWLAPLKPLTDVASVVAATAAPVSIVGTVKTRDTSAANLARITDALTVLQTSLGIGDDVDLGALYSACYAARDVVDVDLSSPAGDTPWRPGRRFANRARSATSGDGRAGGRISAGPTLAAFSPMSSTIRARVCRPKRPSTASRPIPLWPRATSAS
jgi:phage-related baseplate assembly protein